MLPMIFFANLSTGQDQWLGWRPWPKPWAVLKRIGERCVWRKWKWKSTVCKHQSASCMYATASHQASRLLTTCFQAFNKMLSENHILFLVSKMVLNVKINFWAFVARQLLLGNTGLLLRSAAQARTRTSTGDRLTVWHFTSDDAARPLGFPRMQGNLPDTLGRNISSSSGLARGGGKGWPGCQSSAACEETGWTERLGCPRSMRRRRRRATRPCATSARGRGRRSRLARTRLTGWGRRTLNWRALLQVANRSRIFLCIIQDFFKMQLPLLDHLRHQRLW